jgi:hypothetical protein
MVIDPVSKLERSRLLGLAGFSDGEGNSESDTGGSCAGKRCGIIHGWSVYIQLPYTTAAPKQPLTTFAAAYTVHKNSNNFEDLRNGSNRRLAM